MANGNLSNGSVNSPPRIGLQDHALSWTDDLPVCHLSGVGFSTNQIYREDGYRREEHEFEDRSSHFRLDDGCFLYGLFDGHDGSKAANFAAQRMPAEILLGQLLGKNTDAEVREVLYQAFIAVEKGYFESMDDLIAQRTNVQLQLPEGISNYEAYRQFPDIISKLQSLDSEIQGGTTVTMALIYQRKLFVANVGDSRALLCKVDQHEGILRVLQLSVDHTIMNEDELFRLSQIGLDVEKLTQSRKLGNSDNTRCIGDYHVKGGYRDIEALCSAEREPVIADPYVIGGLPLDDSCCFLIFMSDGLYQALEDATGTDRVNAEIAGMVASEFSVQSTLNGVAQAVVDKVVRIHHDVYMTGSVEVKRLCQKRGDMTLLVRNFNYPLPNAINSPTGGGRYYPVSVPFYQPNVPVTVTIPPQVPFVPLTGSPEISSPSTPISCLPNSLETPTPTSELSPHNFLAPIERTNTSTDTFTSTNSSEEGRFPSRFYQSSKLVLDDDGKIEPYVDFADFFRAIEELTEAQRETLTEETKPKPAYEAISEESDTQSAPEN